MYTGVSYGRSWIKSDSAYFYFQLKPDSVISNEIKCTFWGGDAGRCAFDLLVNNVKITTIRLTASSPGKFITLTYPIPHAITNHKATVYIKFQAKTDSVAGPLYGCIMQTSAATTYSWPLNIHDPSSIIKCGSTYYIYGTGDGIFTASSTDLVKWKSEPTPFAKWGYPTYVKAYAPKFEGTFWAPECMYMNGKYYLYYSASDWGTKNSCIGVATNTTLNPSDPAYKWEDKGLVISSNASSNYNAIDPAIMRDPTTGKIWLTYGSFNIAGIKTTELDSVTGKIKNTANQYSVCNHYDNGGYIGEASFMIYHSGYYYLFVNFGGCCAGVSSSYYIITGRSASPSGPFLDKAGANLYKTGSAGGGSIVLKHDDTRGYDDRFYGPGCLGYFAEGGTEYVSFHYYDPNFPYPGQAAGGPMLAVAKLKWDANGWPIISMDWLEQGRYKIAGKSSGYFWDKSGTLLVQNASSVNATQEWDLYALGTGEYKFSNAAVVDNFVETSGADRNGNLQLNAFANAIYEKFRILKSSVNNEYWFYQSAGLRVIEVPYNSKLTNYQLGVYWFNNNDCQKWYPSWVSEIPTSTEDISSKDEFRLFPNPVKDKLFVESKTSDINIELFDINGRLRAKKSDVVGSTSIEMATFEKGIYYARITGKGTSKTVKIFKN
jgi:arabinan endo-1,5-alpha-L-arabinosidase